jgi:hypothetical protein
MIDAAKTHVGRRSASRVRCFLTEYPLAQKAVVDAPSLPNPVVRLVGTALRSAR